MPNSRVRALTEKRIKGAGLDVFEQEPLPPGDPMYKLENVLLSPHCADHTAEWLNRAMRFFRDECDFGMGYVNLPCIGAEVHLPFGGVKKSGNGHPSAAGLIEAVTHKTAWTVNHAEEVKMAQGLTTDVK